MKEIEDWIISWFEKNTDVKKDEIRNILYENYFERGGIDSLKFIEFITDIEYAFKIQFSNDEFQNRMFSTINGLCKIIESKKNERL